MRVTIKDVAKEAGVSITSVSLVLNGNYDKVSAETKQRILEVAAKLKYRPNHIAMSMVKKTTKTIGLVLPDISNIYFSELAKQIEQECYALGYNMLYGNTQDRASRDIEYINIFLDRNVDAIIMVLSNTIDKHLAEIESIINSTDTPILILDRKILANKCTNVLVNQKLGGYIATKHLIDLGHTSIGCISGPTNTYSGEERLEGYKTAMADHDIPIRPELIVEGNYHRESGMKALPSLLGQGVTAIFACNDMMALGVYKQAVNYNISIPQDLSVIGFDDIFIADSLIPPLSSIAQPSARLAKVVVEQALAAINDPDHKNEVIVFDPILMIRGSTKALDRA